nr:hypothetical protein [Leekyejoonella antrihumi]
MPLVGLLRQYLPDVLPDQLADVSQHFLAELDGLPVLLDQALNQVGLHRNEVAAVLPVLTTEAVKVLVIVTATVAGYLKAEWFTTQSAEDRALQIRGSHAWLLLALHSALTDTLASVEQRFADER